MHKRIECHIDEFDGYEIIVESVQSAPGSTWMANVRVRKDGVESPKRYDFDTEYETSEEAKCAGVESGHTIVRDINR
ncbi:MULTISPECIES: DUF6566 family protein [Burkholderia]|uniref:DUF6566 family protein n=1 Tax=Burkholderia TaxID=32008 RepID=UPI00299E2903|nr:DUF6566 family protein [Burkholderia arboris]